MGGVATKCADIENGAGSSKALDAETSDEEEEEEEEEEGDDEEDEKREAEQSLKHRLTRGHTADFVENISNAKAVGVDEDQIVKAEAILEQHRATQRREVFEGELSAFMKGDKSDDLAWCQEMRKRGSTSGANETAMAPLLDRIKKLELSRDLNSDEVTQAKRFVETCTRNFLRACVKGRATVWVDLNSGTKQQVIMHIDLLLRSITLRSAEGAVEIATCMCSEIVAKKAADVEDLSDSDGVARLSNDESAYLVAIVGGESPWILMESSPTTQNEMIMALAVLAGVGLNGKK